MTEKIYYTDTDFINFTMPEEGAVGCFMSGGADSSLMCYLMAKVIKDNNLDTKVYPITAEFLHRPYNLKCAYEVVEKVSELTGFEFELHPCFIIPNHRGNFSDDDKIVVMSRYTRRFAKCFNWSTIYNGLTANPPIDNVPDTKHGQRQTCRDDMNWRKQQEAKQGLTLPFLHIDKRVIGQLYKKYNLIDSLLPLTRSCEAEREETNFFSKDCFEVRKPGDECWWCRERQYGFNDVIPGGVGRKDGQPTGNFIKTQSAWSNPGH